MNAKRKIWYSVGFGLITVSVALFRAHPVDGFLPSMYAGVPLITWVLLIISFSIFGFTLYTQSKKNHLGFVGVCLVPITIISIPKIRTGLPYGRQDTLAQIGHSQELNWNNGFDPEILSYPFLHLHIYALDLVAPLGLDNFYGAYVPILYVIYIALVALTSRVLFEERSQIITTLLISCLVLFGGYATQPFPNAVALYLSFLVLFTLILVPRIGVIRCSILTMVGVAAVGFAHPLVTLILLKVFVISFAVHFVLTKKHTVSAPFDLYWPSSTYIVMGALSIIILFEWYMAAAGSGRSIVAAVQFLLGIEAPVSSSSQVGERTGGLSQGEFLELFFFLYGGRSFVGLLTVMGVTMMAYLWWYKGNRRGHFLLVVPLIAWLFANGIQLIIGLIAPQAGFPPLRFVDMIYLTAPFFSGYFILTSSMIIKKTNIRICTIVLVISLILTMQMFGVYGSDRTTGINQQQTEHEVVGVSWLIENKDDNVAAIGFGSPRFEQSLAGRYTVRAEKRDEFPRGEGKFTSLPLNLTTESGSIITEELDNSRYMSIHEADYHQGRTPNLYPIHEELLAADSNKLYSNNEYRLYKA